MWSLALSALTALVPKLVNYAVELWEKYGKEWLIYRKGATDQKRKDTIAQQSREADEAARAMERVNEIQRKAQDKRGTPVDGSDLFGRVRDDGNRS